MGRALAALLLLVCPLLAQRIPNEYLVELSEAPLLDRSTVEASARVASITGEQTRFRQAAAALGARVIANLEAVGNLVAVRLEADDPTPLRSLPGVKAVYPVFLRKPHLDRALRTHSAEEAWAGLGGVAEAGRGMKIAIIDTGIDPAHPAFQAAPGEPPTGYPRFRREADRDSLTGKIIVARSYDDLYGSPGATSARDIVGHGTGVAMAAGGNPQRANYANVSGAAPQAFLGAYRVFPYDSDGASDAVILQAIEDAINDGMDVINLSLGSLVSSADTDRLYDNAFRRAGELGVVVVVSASNAGPDTASIASPAYSPEAIAVAATVNDREFTFAVRADGETFLAQPGNGPNAPDAIAGLVFDVRQADSSGLACQPLQPGSLAGRIALVDRGSCLFEVKLNNLETAGARAAIVVNNTAQPERFTMAVGAARLPSMMISQADGAALRPRLSADSEIPVEVTFNGIAVERDGGAIADFSGRGPSITRLMKPDLAAVGSGLYTAATATNSQAELYDGSGYLVLDGTSFSAPIVAGAAAIVKQARPQLTGAQYRSLLINTASERSSPAAPEPRPLEAGAGILNIDAALRSTLAATPATLTFGVSSGTVDQTRTLTIFNLGSEPDQVTLEIQGLEGPAPVLDQTILNIAPGESYEVRLRLEGTGLSPGVSQGFVRVRGRSTLRIPYWYATRSDIPEQFLVLYAEPEVARRGGTATVYFRLVDTTGVAIASDRVTVSAVTPGASVIGLISRDSDSPGVYEAAVRLSNSFGAQRFAVEFGSFRREFTIPVF
jgi:minor extracellular serine protease Vpr